MAGDPYPPRKAPPPRVTSPHPRSTPRPRRCTSSPRRLLAPRRDVGPQVRRHPRRPGRSRRRAGPARRRQPRRADPRRAGRHRSVARTDGLARLPLRGPRRGPARPSGRLRPRRRRPARPRGRSASPASRPSPSPSPKPKPKPKPVAATSSGPSGLREQRPAAYSTSISGKCGNIGLNNDAARLCSAVDSVFHLGSIGGYRPNAGEHSTGQAVDFMISSRSQGDAIAAWVQSHVGEFNVQYVIWRQRYWEPGRLLGPHGGPRVRHREPLRPRARDRRTDPRRSPADTAREGPPTAPVGGPLVTSP